MASPKESYEQSIQKMQQSISRLDRELERSRHLLSHDITIDNRTKQDLNFIIKVQEDDEGNFIKKSESKVTIPHQSFYQHRISSTPRERQHTEYYSDNRTRERPLFIKTFQTPQTSEGYMTRPREHFLTLTSQQVATSVKFERKFQPFSHLQQKQISSGRQVHTSSQRHVLAESSVQTEEYEIRQRTVPQSKISEKIQQEGSINYLPSYLKNDRYQTHDGLEHTDTINLPVLLSEMNQKQHLIKQAYVQQSPQVMNYLRQDYTHHHSDINTPIHSKAHDQDMAVTFSPLESGKSDRQKSRQKQWTIQPLSLGYQNNKKYFEQVKERQMLNNIKSKADERRSRLKTQSQHQLYQTSRKSNEKHGYIANFQLASGKKQKANDLFLERKSLFIKNLAHKKEPERKTPVKTAQRSRSKNHSVSYQALSTTLKKQRDHSRELSPKVREISERLYSRSKEKLQPCDHYQRHSQSIERERFYSIVNQNNFVQKYVSKEEQEELFQKFRRQDESVSSWPMKILNYTYSKLQKINSSRYTIRKIYK